MLFRGTQDGRVLAFDFKTGKQVWETTICDPKRGESVPSAPIAWDGLVFVGNAGGDFKGGKGQMYALDAKDRQDRLAVLSRPQSRGRRGPGPAGQVAARHVDLEQRARHTHQRRRDLDVVHARHQERACCTSREAIRRPTSPRGHARARISSPTRSSCSTPRPGDYKNHFKVVQKDWHDWDVSNPPILLQTMGGKQLMAVAPKDGHLYGFDLATNNLLYRVPVTTIENVEGTFAVGQNVHFCPGPVGGTEWNTPGYDPTTNLILTGDVDWCDTVTIKD